MLNPERWLEAHGDVLYRYALVRLRSAELAEDCVQETFVAALKGAAGFDGRSVERTWLVGILRHKIVDCLRRKWREVPVSQMGDAAEAGSDAEFFATMFDRFGHWRGLSFPSWANPRTALEEEDFRRVLTQCLGGLPGRLADAFVLREVEQLESEEVCQVLGITPTNFWAMMHRARSRLRVCLTANWFKRPKGSKAADKA